MELVPGNSLITASPEDGRALAVLMARNTIHAVRPDVEVLTNTMDSETLTAAAHIVSIEFATIAAANDYWR
ncbi:hexameric tyrosine-coordinated heme protein [Planotetraspora sp. A-T 1434]|uniref:hexameric tyrosine-coordinated heme protein n=1 Tax=Planotetraspora sp. A-T 1434 TaxID=2979219 RepID=UPI0021C039EE|nr:hexameric tyrosine-coordinated heme protein [Planotetraspora sp. A-T 1434]MCT9935096.1 hexameric tyrosine-coordinated heme protein [Planotetraspora sp. A-T 1434]